MTVRAFQGPVRFVFMFVPPGPRLGKGFVSFRDSKAKSIMTVTAVYLAAGLAGICLYRSLPYDYWLDLLIADEGGTVLVFAFSVFFGNASVYDPYWSVFPVAVMVLSALGRDLTGLNILHLAVIGLWGVRLTGNWAYTFGGLNSQDWRYTMLRDRTGKMYPAVNFLGIHLVPTLIVYLCVMPAVCAARQHAEGGVLSFLCVSVSLCAVIMQGTADHQMHAFRKEHRGELIRTGLWTWSRHPNYLGEILMWWGIGASAAAAMPGNAWMLTGAVVNTLLFVFVSIPMAEERQSRKPGFEEYKKETRMLLPIRPR